MTQLPSNNNLNMMSQEIGLPINQKKVDIDRANELFEKSKECEISKYNCSNKSTFLHIFDYQQNKDLKK